MDSDRGMRVQVLGPVEAWVDGRQVALRGQRRRALLAVLALMRGSVVSTERLIDELWGEDPPARARDSLQVLVSRVRKALTEAGAVGDCLVGRAGGYVLELGPGESDVDRWEGALDRARQARDAGRFEVARTAIEEALGVWRGAPLAGVGAHELLDGERARLEEQRLAATIEGIELDLELGRHGELLGQLEALVMAHPFKERLVELQMVALYRCGRQADALEAFHAARTRLIEELGIEPGEPLRALHEDVLRHADALGAEPVPVAWPGARGERRLPVPPNRTIGREHDVEVIGERLRAGAVRLLTLTGPGGVGKTRLAVESARAVEQDFGDGGCFVSLAALQRADDVPAAIVAALGVIVVSGESPTQSVERFLAAKHLLLVVDNFEHVLAAAPLLSGLLEACPALTVLATSREPLSLHAEQRYPVSPLALPEQAMDSDAMASVDAVVLFDERARSHDPDFDLAEADRAIVAEICRRLDGLPLAIELAAACCGVLSVGEIAHRLEEALRDLSAGPRDAPARQQTLRATIEWSHNLLDDAEKEVFARFAVFAGDATIEAAESVTGASLDTLDRLVAKSLLVRRRRAHAPTRLRMLETIRAYATERLVFADEQAIRERHYRHHLALAERNGSERTLWGAEGNEHLATIDADIDNLHAALSWAIGRADAARALAMAAALGGYWIMRNRHADALEWIDRTLALPGADAHPAARVSVLRTKVMCLWRMARRAEEGAVLAELEGLARRLDDPLILARALQLRIYPEFEAGRPQAADAAADEAVHWARAAGDEWEVAEALRRRTIAASTVADLRRRVDVAASLLSEVGNVHHLAVLLTDAAYAALCLGSARDATHLAARAAPIARALDDPFTSMNNSSNLGLAALLTGDTGTASRAFREALVLCRDMVVRRLVSECLRGVAAIAAVDGDPTRAATLVGAADALRTDKPEDPVEARLDETFFEPARTRCGTDAWDESSRQGSTLGFTEAIAYALGPPRT